MASVQEWDRDSAVDVSLKELDWLIGTWQAANKDRELTSTFEWDENKTFIRGKFTVKEGGKVIESGTQIIGKDNAEGAIRSWVFQTDGGFGDGYWTREGPSGPSTSPGPRPTAGSWRGPRSISVSTPTPTPGRR